MLFFSVKIKRKYEEKDAYLLNEKIPL